MSGNERIRQDKEMVVVEKASLKTPERREGGSHADTNKKGILSCGKQMQKPWGRDQLGE